GTHDNATTVVASSLDEPREFPGDRNKVPRSDRNLRAIDCQPAASPKNRIRTLHPAVQMIIRHSADNSTLHNSSAPRLALSLMHLSNELAAVRCPWSTPDQDHELWIKSHRHGTNHLARNTMITFRSRSSTRPALHMNPKVIRMPTY